MPTPFTPRDPGFDARVRASIARQTFMETLGAGVEHARPGELRVDSPDSPTVLALMLCTIMFVRDRDGVRD